MTNVLASFSLANVRRRSRTLADRLDSVQYTASLFTRTYLQYCSRQVLQQFTYSILPAIVPVNITTQHEIFTLYMLIKSIMHNNPFPFPQLVLSRACRCPAPPIPARPQVRATPLLVHYPGAVSCRSAVAITGLNHYSRLTIQQSNIHACCKCPNLTRGLDIFNVSIIY